MMKRIVEILLLGMCAELRYWYFYSKINTFILCAFSLLQAGDLSEGA
jgi:hypothetical protein